MRQEFGEPEARRVSAGVFTRHRNNQGRSSREAHLKPVASLRVSQVIAVFAGSNPVFSTNCCPTSSLVEHVLDEDEAVHSIRAGSTIKIEAT
jgi:hypothetical protein